MDHGKTTLVRCLTGVDTDRLKEEKRRGLSIEPGVAPLQLPSGRRIALMDVPGHRDFLGNTIRGLSSVDTAILVVAADDGVMPQTRDHLEVLNFLEAKGGFVALSKADLVDQETLELAEMEIREILEGTFLEGKPVVPFSAVQGRGLEEILRVAETEAEHVETKAIRAPFRLWIDQVRTFAGFGTVVTGTVLSGVVRRDDIVQLLPGGREAKVRFLEVHHQRVEEAAAGERVGLNLQGVSVQEVGIGTVLTAPGVLQPTRLLNSELHLLPTARRPMLNRRRIKLYVGTHCTTALLVMMERERLHPGEKALVQLRLQEPLAVLPADPFVISPVNQHSVIGGGKILETPKEKYRAAKSEKTLAYLQPLQSKDVESILNLFLARYPSRPVSGQEIISYTGLAVDSVEAAIEARIRKKKLLHVGGRGYFERVRYDALKSRAVDIAKKILSKDAFKPAVSADEIRFRLDSNLDDALFERMLGDLCKESKLTKAEAGYRVPNFVVKLPLQRERLMKKIVEFARYQGYGTFSAGTFWKRYGEGLTHRDIEKVLDHLHAQKRLVRLNDGRFLTSEALHEIKEKITRHIQRKGSLTIQDSAQILGFGRTRAVPILDYLDSIGLTCRVGDVRVLVSESGSMLKQKRG